MVEAGCEGTKASGKASDSYLDSLYIYDQENYRNSVLIHLYVMINTLIVNRDFFINFC